MHEILLISPASADHNVHYGSEPGIKFYTHVSDRFAPFHTKVIAANASEAAYVLDGLLHHESSLSFREHYTDTGGATEHVFGLCHLLGFRFAPRFVSCLLAQEFKRIGCRLCWQRLVIFCGAKGLMPEASEVGLGSGAREKPCDPPCCCFSCLGCHFNLVRRDHNSYKGRRNRIRSVAFFPRRCPS